MYSKERSFPYAGGDDASDEYRSSNAVSDTVTNYNRTCGAAITQRSGGKSNDRSLRTSCEH